jgi:hypothetical protein
MGNLKYNGIHHQFLLNSVKTILDECGFSYIWETQIFISEVWLKFNIKMRLHDQFQQTWRGSAKYVIYFK